MKFHNHYHLGFGLIETAHGNLPKTCKLPSISQGKSCPLSGFAWSYDVTSSRCRIVNTRGCSYATENQFATKADCKRMCPEQIELEITLIPTSEVLCDFLAKVKQPITEEMKRKFQLCHTIHQNEKEQRSR